MSKFLIVLSSLIFITLSSSGQYYFYNNNYYDNDLIWEVGGSFGTMHGWTDVGRKQFSAFLPSNLDFKSTRTNGGIYAGVTYRDVIGATLQLNYGSIAGADSNGIYKYRNLSYRTSINEISVIGELYPLMLLKNWDEMPKLSPYVAAGIGYFSFNPQTYYKGQYINLQPLRTEGQGFIEFPDRKPYKLTNVCIPFGGGFKYEVSSLFTLRFEGLAHYTFTDYLDDASTTSIDPSIYSNYFLPQTAAIAAALTERSKERDPNSTGGVTTRGGNAVRDMYFSFNLKAGLTLGRQRVR